MTKRTRPHRLSVFNARSIRCESLERRQLLSGQLFPAQQFPVGGATQSVTAADFNGDNIKDLAVPSGGSSGVVSILIGANDGTFGAATNFPVAKTPRSIATGDFNGDQKVDLAVANPGSDSSTDNKVSILLGDGNGTFAPAVNMVAGSRPYHVVVADFNNDNKLDVAAANLASKNVSIFIGAGNGSFAAASNFSAVNNCLGLTVADFNNDGKLDLATGNTSGSATSTTSVLLGNGDGTFAAAQLFTTGGNSLMITSGDFNGDQKIDLATANYGSFGAQGSTVSVLLGNGDGTFAPQTEFYCRGGPRYITSGDFDGDQKLDLAVANLDLWELTILKGDGAGNFAISQTLPSGGPTPFCVYTTDLNSDGKLDLVNTSNDAGNVTVMLGDGAGNFATRKSYTVQYYPTVAAGDLNNDGHTDMITAGTSGTGYVFLLGDGQGSFSSVFDPNFGPNSQTRDVCLADLDRDGNTDLITGNANGTVSIFLGHGDATFDPPVYCTVGATANTLTTGDFNRDGKIDIASGNNDRFSSLEQATSVLFGNGDGTFAPSVFVTGAHEVSNVLAVDVDNDGDDDLVSMYVEIYVRLSDGAGGFAPPIIYQTNNGASGLTAADFNRDGLIDLATSNVGFSPQSTPNVTVFLGTGGGTFAAGTVLAQFNRPASSITAADFDGDGFVDLAAGTELRNVALLRGNGAGGFAAPLFYAASSGASIITADFNADGKSDLATGAGDIRLVTVLLNQRTAVPFATLENGTLTIDAATGGNGAIDIALQNDQYVINSSVGSLTFDRWSVKQIFLQGSTANDVFNIAGSIRSATAVEFYGGGGDDTLNITRGGVVASSDLGASAALSINVATEASIGFDASQHLRSLNLAGTATANLLPSGTRGGARVLYTAGLSLSAQATLDLNDNSMVLDYDVASTLAVVQAWINAARGNGEWTGVGLTSTAAKNANPRNTTLAAIESADFKSLYGAKALFDGEPFDVTAVLVKYTYYGDTDFNGVVDFDDYSRIDAGFNNNRTGWLNGDVDGNGIVDFDDYSLVDLAFNTQAPVLRSKLPGLAGKPGKGGMVVR